MIMQNAKKLFTYTEEVSHDTKCPMRRFVSWGTLVDEILFDYIMPTAFIDS